MDIDAKDYQLRCQLRGHEDDARGICICGNAGIATSSRDKTVRFWTLDEPQKRDYSLSKILLGHTSFVGPLAWVPPNEDLPGGGIVSGGMDTLVIVWNLATGEKVKTLKGHKLQVTGVALDGSDIVSVSVDCTLRRWREGQLVDAWEGHKAAIQAIVKLPTGELVTGSTDMTLKLWKGKSCMHTFLGHTDTVRGVAAVPDLGILSASHDGSIRLWAVSGELLMEMVGHTSIVYSVDAHTSGLIVSGSEDCSAKIWKDGVCIQSIEHPGCVWDTKFLENGDIVTACSDGVVRIWTLNHEKIADDVEINSFSAQLSQYKISRKRVGGMKLEDLPGLDALKTPGSSDGQTKIVREGDNGVAYSWNMREQKWDKIGEVVDGPDDNMSRPLLDGIQYDYVFDVDIGDGEPVRKLPYNRSGQRDFTPDPMFRDPYTGASAYVPGAPSAMPGVSKPSYKHIPKKSLFWVMIKHDMMKGMLVFDVAQFDGILKKISEFNSVLLSDPEKSHLSMNEVDVSRLNAIVKILKDTSHYHSTTFSDVDVALLLKLLNTWPVAMLFPVVDVVRMIVLHPDGAGKLLQHVKGENDTIVELIRKVAANPPLPANLLTSLRALTNLFKNTSYNDWLLAHRVEILDAFSSCWSSTNKNVQLSYATLLINYAVLLVEKKDKEGQSQVLSAALAVLFYAALIHFISTLALKKGGFTYKRVMAGEGTVDSDSKFRALVAIGSLMLEGLVRSSALDFGVVNIAKAAKASNDAKLAEVGADIEQVAKHG
ncbi:transducin family protein / WD-40 repeat family protein [Striga asiatica]|uniref:Transducin family protein / WD-40 repeat family protein n=1 Tax=Striga asiatica TaxID=4170 RepID=A0A5A7R1X9_STRAF|nr:transducin family protein / WD-40 repeat family protein [Striga asiatica]